MYFVYVIFRKRDHREKKKLKYLELLGALCWEKEWMRVRNLPPRAVPGKSQEVRRVTTGLHDESMS